MVSRPPVEQLERVDDEEILIRFVPIRAYLATAPAGARVQTSAFQTNDFTPNDTSYGSSVWVNSRLALGVTTVLDAQENRKRDLYALVKAKLILELEIDVRLSPQDCPFEDLRRAHASLIGITKERRAKLIRLVEQHLQ